MPGASVSFRKVSKSYGVVCALSDFDLNVEPGEFVTFLGPSGSGKSTALNVLAGFADATSGDVLIGGRSVLDLPPERRDLGMVFQSYSLFPHMTVFENVAFPLRLRGYAAGEIRRRVGQSLEMVQLSGFADRMPKELSGGQRQRVAFARAVVFEPPVLLMDEPLGALDLKLREAMQLEIKHYHAQLGCTIIFVTHDQGEALVMSDRVVVMKDGQISQVDTPKNIYDRPNSRYVAEFIGQTNIFSLSHEGRGGLQIAETGLGVPLDAFDGEKSGVISVRPEKIHRMTSDTPDIHAFQATIDEVLFLGNVIQYEVRTGSGARFFFQEHRGPDVPLLNRGEAVQIGFRFKDALVVRDGGVSVEA